MSYRQRDKWSEIKNLILMIMIFLSSVLTALFAGCKSKYRSSDNGGSFKSNGESVEFKAPSDPSSPSTISRKTNRRFYFMDKAGVWSLSPVSAVPHPAPAPEASVVEESIEETATTGAAHVDTSRDLSARLESFKPVQYVGCAFLLGAALCFIPWVRIAMGGGKTTQMALGAIGLTLVFGPAIISGHETELIVGSIIAAVIIYLITRLSHKEGMIDANKNGIPDNKE